jgi:hypothetical protein
MATVFAQMRCDSVGSGLFGQFRGADRIRVFTAARISHSRNVVDIDPKPQSPQRFG